MMAMYKLFAIIHRRTDFYKIARAIDELMYPEFYEEKRQQAHNAVMRLAMMHNIIHGIGGYSW